MSPDVRIDNDQIKSVLLNEVIKREVLEGDKAEEARKKITKAISKALRAATAKASEKVSEGTGAVTEKPKES